jgi:hypothetical protein
MSDEDPEAGRPLIRKTRREEVATDLRDEAADLLEAIDSLDFGVCNELELGDEHELYRKLAQARAAMEHVAWLLGTDAIREGDLDEEDDGDPSGEEDQQPDP